MKLLQIFRAIQKDDVLGSQVHRGEYLPRLAVCFGVLAISISLFSPSFYRLLISEDGVVEYGSALLWLLAAGIMAATIVKRHRTGRFFLACRLLLLCFFVACCGEEISWGQRIFNFSGPSYIVELNKQSEFNLHDIGHISIYANLFLAIFVGFFFVYPALVSRHLVLKEAMLRNGLPIVNIQAVQVAAVSVIIWLTIGIRFGTLGFHPYSAFGYYTQMDDEIFEFLAAFSFWCFAFLDLKMKTNCARESLN